MQLTFDVKRDIKRFLPVGGVSLAPIIGGTTAGFGSDEEDEDCEARRGYNSRSPSENHGRSR